MTHRAWCGDAGGGDAGTAPAEFAMVVGLLTFLALAVMQLALVLHVRNTVQDAAAEGARVASLVGNRPADGITRTKDLIGAALGGAYARDVRYSEERYLDHPAAVVTVAAPLPILGLFGPHRGLEVQGHAGIERTPRDP
jgi:hypothetical protein